MFIQKAAAFARPVKPRQHLLFAILGRFLAAGAYRHQQNQQGYKGRQLAHDLRDPDQRVRESGEW